ncbi:MAG: Gfo/Idh/MocA family oxidoreductase, partial [Acidobacteriaceae bacterium]|nr:Gfo/Idh/MocA family oxidoreductase [Acidobacteriaceae bacterium]
MKMFVIGCGSIGRRHTANLRKLGVDDIVVFDPDRERAEALARDCGALAVESIEQGYDKKPRAVLVCAPTSMHLDLASEAIQHGCHVFLEKPLAHALDGVSDFIESIRARNKVVLVGYNLRFDPLLRRVHQMLYT